MTMWRVYFNQSESRGGGKVYLCERPGYWAHWCSNPEDCVPFTHEQAERTAEWNAKHCGDVEGKCFIEEYNETRELVTDKKGSYRAAWYKHLLVSSGPWYPVVKEAI